MKFSIVIPNYNYEKHIGETLRSIIDQDYDNYEIIIVDDGSTDGSVEVIKSIIETEPEVDIKLYIQSNSGQASAVNFGLSKAIGDIIGWINSDDTYERGTFSKVFKVFDNEEVALVYGDINVIDTRGNFIHSLRHFRFSYFLSCFTGFANNMSNNAVFWRTRLNKGVQLNPNFKCALDSELFSRLTLNGKVVKLNCKLANFRLQMQSKASINELDWLNVMKTEDAMVLEKAYENTLISCYIPYKYAKYFKPVLIYYKRFLKILTGDVFIVLYEKWNYKKKLIKRV